MRRYFCKILVLVLVMISVMSISAGTATVLGAPAIRSIQGLKSYNILMSLKGQKAGLVGDKINILTFYHSIVSPRDPQSGLPTGQRMHKPFMISKQVDKTSPIIMNMLCTNENIPELVLTFTDSNPKDSYTIRLTNANIASVDLSEGEDGSGTFIEKISFTYMKIEWIWNDGNIMATDDWEARQ
jgi:type VI secretion system secreted protein Hcp